MRSMTAAEHSVPLDPYARSPSCGSPLLLLKVRALPHSQVMIQFGHVLEHGNPGQRFYDLEDLLNLRLHVDERSLAAAFLKHFAGGGKNSQASAADEAQLSQ